MRALALVDTDSYVKWGAALLARFPAEWDRQIAVVATPGAPSAGQLSAALAGSGFEGASLELTLETLGTRVAADRPDVVVVAMRGPAASVVLRVLSDLPNRPVLVSGLPGISIPATWKALFYRAQADLVVLHSKREIREFDLVAGKRGWDHRLALATLPFIERTVAVPSSAAPSSLASSSAVPSSPDPSGRAPSNTGLPVGAPDGRDIVFAVQSIVPLERADRERVLDILIATARRNPDHRVVIKVRALSGEQQTHDEEHSYPDLLAERPSPPQNLVVAAGAMATALDTAAGLVTVSSTASIEAIARDIPLIMLDEFGISDGLINQAFVGSGLFADGEAVASLAFARPNPQWLDDNYFHASGDDDWMRAVDELLALRASAPLTARPSLRGHLGGALRRAWERKQAFGRHDRTLLGAAALAVGTPARSVVLLGRRIRGRRAHVWDSVAR